MLEIFFIVIGSVETVDSKYHFTAIEKYLELGSYPFLVSKSVIDTSATTLVWLQFGRHISRIVFTV